MESIIRDNIMIIATFSTMISSVINNMDLLRVAPQYYSFLAL